MQKKKKSFLNSLLDLFSKYKITNASTEGKYKLPKKKTKKLDNIYKTNPVKRYETYSIK